MNKHAQALRNLLNTQAPHTIYRDVICKAAAEIDRLDAALRGDNHNAMQHRADCNMVSPCDNCTNVIRETIPIIPQPQPFRKG